MVGKEKEPGLSEVIGFLMIVALLTILFSMYLLYVVPIQGRDAEISHMKYITQEFISLKSDIDGLIINNKINLPIARSFELGTLSSVGSGALSILPVSSFIEASGTLMVNEQNDFLSVMVNGDMIDLSNLPPVIPPPITQQGNLPLITTNPLLEIQCDSPDRCPVVPINFTISDRFYNLTTKGRYSLNNNLGVTDFTLPHVYLNISSDPMGPANQSIVLYYNLSSYDLVLEVFDNLSPDHGIFISEKTLIENLTFGRNYTYNILKDNDVILNNTSDYFLINPTESIPSDQYTPQAITTKVDYFPPRIGAFQYESSNRYWVNQNLLYEMGGLFLNQPADGGSSVLLVPSIALTPIRDISTGEYNLKASINNIRITDTEDISGSVSAQIFAKVDQINQNIFNGSSSLTSDFGSMPATTSSLWKMREGEEPNARAIWLQFIPDDPRVINSTYREDRALTSREKEKMQETTQLWKRGFDQIKTITNKTLSDNADKNPLVGQYSRWMYNFRIVDDTAPNLPSSPPYSANIVIGELAANTISSSCDPITIGSVGASDCRTAVQNYLTNPGGNKFILDYSESEVSLVMQSGAL
jgi:hypothetical protein